MTNGTLPIGQLPRTRRSKVDVRARQKTLHGNQPQSVAAHFEFRELADQQTFKTAFPDVAALLVDKDRSFLQLGHPRLHKLSAAFEDVLLRTRRFKSSLALASSDEDMLAPSQTGHAAEHSVIIEASLSSCENRLADLPVLVSLLTGLPVTPVRFGNGPLPEIIAALVKSNRPDINEDFEEWECRTDPELALMIADHLFGLAVIHDSASLAHLGDIVLHDVSIRHRTRDVLNRLTIRAEMVLGTINPRSVDFDREPETLHELAFEHARVALTVLRASVGCIGTPLLADSFDVMRYSVSALAREMGDLASQARTDLLSDMTRCVETWWWDVFAAEPRVDEPTGVSEKRSGDLVDEEASDRSFPSRTEALSDAKVLIRTLDHLKRQRPTVPIVEQRMRTMERLLQLVADECDRAEQRVIADCRKPADGEVFVADANQNSGSRSVPQNQVVRNIEEESKQSGTVQGQNETAGDRSASDASISVPGTRSMKRSVPSSGPEDGALNSGLTKPALVVLDSVPVSGTREMKDDLKVFREELAGVALPLVRTPDLVPIRQHLTALLPHLSNIIDVILNAVARHETVRIPPILLIGPPGSGKTTLAEELVAAFDLPSVTWDAVGSSDANIFGVDRRWGTAAPGIHLDLIMEHRIANPAIIVDELEKLGGSRRNGDARVKLLGLLEPRRSKAFLDPYLATPLNLSALNWVFTANEVDGISSPLLNRLQRLDCPYPASDHLDLLAPQLLIAEYEARGQNCDWARPLDGTEQGLLKQHWPGGSIRDLRRLIQVVVDSRERGGLMH